MDPTALLKASTAPLSERPTLSRWPPMTPMRVCSSRPSSWISRVRSASASVVQPWATVRSRAIRVVGVAITMSFVAAYARREGSVSSAAARNDSAGTNITTNSGAVGSERQ
jgi:hypothetical protein